MSKHILKIGQKINHEGYLIERGGAGYYICDWDYESETVIAGPVRTLDAARAFIDSRNTGYNA